MENFVSNVFVQEAEDLYHWCLDDQNALTRVGLDWKIQAPAAFELLDQLVHDFRFAFCKFDGMVARVDEIAQGDTNADMVQDLNDLAVLGRPNRDLLEAVGFDFTLIDKAANLSDYMADLLGVTNGERKEDSEALLIRDKAYTYLKQAVDKIRDCGKFAFWRTPERLKGYFSEHWLKANTDKSNTENAKEQPKA